MLIAMAGKLPESPGWNGHIHKRRGRHFDQLLGKCRSLPTAGAIPRFYSRCPRA